MWASFRSLRVYGEPEVINGLVYVNLVKAGPSDPCETDETLCYGLPGFFPEPHMRQVESVEEAEKWFQSQRR